MEKYKNVHGLLSFSIGGSDYISNKGDIIELPDSLYVQTLLNRGHIVPVDNLPDVPEEIIPDNDLPGISGEVLPADNLPEVTENKMSAPLEKVLPVDNILGISEEIISDDNLSDISDEIISDQKDVKKTNKTTKK